MTTSPPPTRPEQAHPRRHRLYFGVTTAVIALFMAASSAPSPLYVVYQHLWGFSPAILTVIFAIYVLGLLGSLLVVGRLSDHVGRRPVLAGAIVVEALALVLFLVAGDTVSLSVARLFQGIATGAAISVLGAALVDLAPAHAKHRAGAVNSVAPTGGLALGAIGCGALVQFGPAPTHLVYAVLLAGMVASGLAVLFMPETVARRQGALGSLVPKAGIPVHLRADLAPVIPVLIAGWALGGLYFSLGPSVAAGVFGLGNHLIGGIVIALLCGIAAITSFLLRPVPAPRLLLPAATALGAGTVLALAGVHSGHVAFAVAGTVVAGVGFGAGALAGFGTVARIARPHERSALIAVVYVISYLAFSVPAVVAGFADTHYGIRPTTEVYTLVVLGLTVVALVLRVALNGRKPASPLPPPAASSSEEPAVTAEPVRSR
ncbi:MFS transporter [Streptomyces fuscigenes]|uniref:MFS transporter n=1 Tax=Streptomyces fuscigenes TaxID=1528880 RepID=UPI001F38A63B|nr:MFS transporter [Streptomyces fuscigenes]MCF3963658.1 MFS transporter [Streptomyces fuscigenes]